MADHGAEPTQRQSERHTCNTEATIKFKNGKENRGTQEVDARYSLKPRRVGRQQFTHKGQLVYEWDQTLEDVNIYIKPPKILLKKYEDEFKKQLKPGQKLPKLEVKITPTHIAVGIQGNPPFLNVCSTHGKRARIGGSWREGEHL